MKIRRTFYQKVVKFYNVPYFDGIKDILEIQTAQRLYWLCFCVVRLKKGR
jgi:hypothetical protein